MKIITNSTNFLENANSMLPCMHMFTLNQTQVTVASHQSKLAKHNNTHSVVLTSATICILPSLIIGIWQQLARRKWGKLRFSSHEKELSVSLILRVGQVKAHNWRSCVCTYTRLAWLRWLSCLWENYLRWRCWKLLSLALSLDGNWLYSIFM